MTIDLQFERNKMPVAQSQTKPPTFPRSDTIDIVGTVYGKALTGLTATLTARITLPDSSVGPNAFTPKTSATSGGIVLTAINTSVSTVRATINEDDTKAFQTGQKIVFDIEFVTTTTPPVTRTVKGAFILEEDYSLN